MYELKLELEWKLFIAPSDSELPKGTIVIPDISPESLDDLSMEVSTSHNSGHPTKELVRTKGVPLLRDAITSWAVSLQTAISEGYQISQTPRGSQSQQPAPDPCPAAASPTTTSPTLPATQNIPTTIISNDNEVSKNEASLQSVSDTAAAAEAAGICAVGKVFENSPAHASGLVEGDILLRVGNVSRLQNTFKSISESVLLEIQKNQGGSVHVLAWRPSSKTHVTATVAPREWGGGGLLGCLLFPYPPN